MRGRHLPPGVVAYNYRRERCVRGVCARHGVCSPHTAVAVGKGVIVCVCVCVCVCVWPGVVAVALGEVGEEGVHGRGAAARHRQVPPQLLHLLEVELRAEGEGS